MTCLATEVHDRPMPFALLKIADCQRRQLVPPQAASEEKGKKCPIAFTLHFIAVGCLPQGLRLLGRQPVAQPDAQFLHALDAPDSGRQVGVEEAAVGGLVRQTANRP